MRSLRLKGRNVTLRAFRTSELDALLDAYRRRNGTDGPVLPVSRAKIRRRIEGSGRWDRGWLILAVEANGRLVGDIQARGFPRESVPPGVYEFGISLFDRADRGRGIGREAVALLTEWLLTDGGASRVQASTALTNKAMRRVLERTGYHKEGVLRGFMPGPHGRKDYVLYARTKRPRWRATV